MVSIRTLAAIAAAAACSVGTVAYADSMMSGAAMQGRFGGPVYMGAPALMGAAALLSTALPPRERKASPWL